MNHFSCFSSTSTNLKLISVALQKKLEQTEHVLFDLEEKHQEANATIKEKEFLISNLLKSGKQGVVLCVCPHI